MLTKAVKNGNSGALISVKPQYVKQILAGRKKWEYRKREIDATYFYIYETAPVKRIVARADIDLIVCGSPKEIWGATCMAAGISEDEFNAYYQGNNLAYAYRLCNVKTVEEVHIRDLGVMRAPQSWCYVKGVKE